MEETRWNRPAPATATGRRCRDKKSSFGTRAFCSLTAGVQLWMQMFVVTPSAPEVWSRFQHHASRVRELQLSSRSNVRIAENSPSYVIDISVYGVLHDHSLSLPLLPNLRQLACDNCMLKTLDLFLGPSVEILIITGFDGADGVLLNILQSIQRHCGRNLRNLTVTKVIALKDQGTVDLASQALYSLDNLTTLSWNAPIPEHVFRHLSQLSSLVDFTYVPSDINYKRLLADNHAPGFPSLHKLRILREPQGIEHTISFKCKIT